MTDAKTKAKWAEAEDAAASEDDEDRWTLAFATFF